MKNILKIALIASLVTLFSCKEESFKLSGVVKNVTENNVSNATISLTGSKTYTAITDQFGKYSFPDVEEGTYDLNITKLGYNDYTISANITKDQSDYNFSLMGSATITGTVINSQTGYGLDSATISFAFSNIKSTQSEDIEFQMLTNSYGNYSISNAPTGIFTCIIEKPGYTPRTIPSVAINAGTNEIEQSVLVESLELGGLRIILSWGESPSDLDSHLTGPDGMGERFHMYYSDKRPITSIILDVDDTSSYGPETTTISSFNEGTYRFSVFNFSDQSSNGGEGIALSPTVVEVYDNTGLINTFTAPSFPTNGGNTWRVFEVEANNQGTTIIPVNTYVLANDDNTNDMKQSGKKKTMSSKNF